MPEPVVAEIVSGAIATLRRIALLVERSGGPRHRSSSFRRAASALAAMTPAEIAERVEAGTLTDVCGRYRHEDLRRRLDRRGAC